jgi:hypothetical protein
LFTFTTFPKDLTDSTNRDIGNGGSNEEDSISSKTDSNDLKIDTVGQLENENVFTISGEGKENDADNILILMYASVGSAINNKTSADWDTSIYLKVQGELRSAFARNVEVLYSSGSCIPITGGLKYSGPWDHWSQKFFYAPKIIYERNLI